MGSQYVVHSRGTGVLLLIRMMSDGHNKLDPIAFDP